MIQTIINTYVTDIASELLTKTASQTQLYNMSTSLVQLEHYGSLSMYQVQVTYMIKTVQNMSITNSTL
jgi:hypothetical protein